MRKLLSAGFVLLLLILALAGCVNGPKANHDGYTINGQLQNALPNTKIFLELVDSKQVRAIDTAEVSENGTFEMMGKVNEKGIARLRIGMGRNAVMFIVDNATFDVNLDVRNIGGATVSGNPESQQLTGLIGDIQARRTNSDYLKNFIDSVSSPLVAYVAVNYLKIEDEYETYKKLAARMQKEIPNSKLTKDFGAYVNSMKNIANIAVGKVPPDINLPSPDGKNIALSSLKGKVVLLDFWASWCRPCRKENPNVVRAYKEYKDKGFEVYSVSLDRSKDKWVKAIKDDNLIWAGHVSDLGGWQSSAAALYNIKSIPQTLLLDREGKIIAKNLRGSALDNKLAELFGSAQP